jgi:hypothetical protein
VSDVELRAGDTYQTDGIVSIGDLSDARLTVDFIVVDWGPDPGAIGDIQKLSRIESLELFAANRRYFIGNSDPGPGQPLIYEFPPNLLEWGVNLPRTPEERAAGPQK